METTTWARAQIAVRITSAEHQLAQLHEGKPSPWKRLQIRALEDEIAGFRRILPPGDSDNTRGRRAAAARPALLADGQKIALAPPKITQHPQMIRPPCLRQSPYKAAKQKVQLPTLDE